MLKMPRWFCRVIQTRSVRRSWLAGSRQSDQSHLVKVVFGPVQTFCPGVAGVERS
jgi:hypothetical protein